MVKGGAERKKIDKTSAKIGCGKIGRQVWDPAPKWTARYWSSKSSEEHGVTIEQGGKGR